MRWINTISRVGVGRETVLAGNGNRIGRGRSAHEEGPPLPGEGLHIGSLSLQQTVRQEEYTHFPKQKRQEEHRHSHPVSTPRDTRPAASAALQDAACHVGACFGRSGFGIWMGFGVLVARLRGAQGVDLLFKFSHTRIGHIRVLRRYSRGFMKGEKSTTTLMFCKGHIVRSARPSGRFGFLST